jgi:hypothetical protein
MFSCSITSIAETTSREETTALSTSLDKQRSETGLWFFSGGLAGILNSNGEKVSETNLPESTSSGELQSAPSQIHFAPGIGLRLPSDTLVCFAPSLIGFAGYWLWSGEKALPAEVEQRTTWVPGILIDLPAVVNIRTANSIFSIGTGIAFLLRYAFLANSVPEEESGDRDLMNAWFWQNARFVFPSAQFGWDFITENGWAIGISLQAYLPLAPFFDSGYQDMTTTEKLDGGMLVLSTRFSVPR